MNERLLSGALAVLLLLLSAGSADGAVVPRAVSDFDAEPAGLFLDEPSAPEARAGDDEDAPYTLSAAYPNPFRSRTKFDLRIEETQQISVDVYNILGQKVRSLFKGEMKEGRKRTFTLEARNLPSGLYLYRIRGETFTAARRVTLVQ